jgi:riboflavin synthase alpha subunit
MKGGCGICISVTKAIDVLLGQELRTLCETAQRTLSDRLRNGDEVQVKHSLIAAKRLDGHAMGKIDTLLAEIGHGRIAVSMELEDHDKRYAATCK